MLFKCLKIQKGTCKLSTDPVKTFQTLTSIPWWKKVKVQAVTQCVWGGCDHFVCCLNLSTCLLSPLCPLITRCANHSLSEKTFLCSKQLTKAFCLHQQLSLFDIVHSVMFRQHYGTTLHSEFIQVVSRVRFWFPDGWLQNVTCGVIQYVWTAHRLETHGWRWMLSGTSCICKGNQPKSAKILLYMTK